MTISYFHFCLTTSIFYTATCVSFKNTNENRSYPTASHYTWNKFKLFPKAHLTCPFLFSKPHRSLHPPISTFAPVTGVPGCSTIIFYSKTSQILHFCWVCLKFLPPRPFAQLQRTYLSSKVTSSPWPFLLKQPPPNLPLFVVTLVSLWHLFNK